MIDISLLLFALAGVFFGTIAGIVPGIGLTAMMAMVGMFFATDSAVDILVFYIGMLCASQYAGSMVAIGFGVPGESSSTPAVREGHVLFRRGQGNLAIGTTAIGSFLGSLVSIVIFFGVLFVLKDLMLLWNNNVQVIIFTIALLLVVWTSDNKWYVSLIFVLIGTHFGLTGISYATQIEWATFDQPWLYNGIPMIPFLMGIFVLPEVINGIGSVTPRASNSQLVRLDIKENITEIFKHRWVILYSSIIGFFSGLIPNLTTRLASNISWLAQKNIVQRTKGYTTGDLSCLISAETSNNAASFSVLLPLILLAMPITPSEFIVFEYMSTALDTIDLDFVINNAGQLLAMFFLINLTCLFIAWPLANQILKAYQIPKKTLSIVLFTLIIFPVVFEGLQQGMLPIYLSMFLFFAIIGMFLKKSDTMPIVFAFLLIQSFVEAYWIFFQKII